MVSPRYAVGRFLIASACAAIAFGLLAPTDKAWWVRAVVGWDVGALTLVTLAWSVILRADCAETKRRAGMDDPGRHLVFGIALTSSVFSLFAAGFVLKQVKSFPGAEQTTWTLLTLAAIALSWVMTHTAYTLRYAHLYYRGGGAHGLQFPGTEPPADIDFAYFSFTVGMCFQVSDVVVTTTNCRRAVLLHSVLSFVYNTMILALALNLVFGLMT
jgi:uncharacterized membrane protein